MIACYSLRICGEGFNHHDLRNAHEKRHKDGTLEMVRPPRSFVRKNFYDASLRQENSIVTCELCGKQFTGIAKRKSNVSITLTMLLFYSRQEMCLQFELPHARFPQAG